MNDIIYIIFLYMYTHIVQEFIIVIIKYQYSIILREKIEREEEKKFEIFNIL